VRKKIKQPILEKDMVRCLVIGVGIEEARRRELGQMRKYRVAADTKKVSSCHGGIVKMNRE
jgi:hypothetical protein